MKCYFTSSLLAFSFIALFWGLPYFEYYSNDCAAITMAALFTNYLSDQSLRISVLGARLIAWITTMEARSSQYN